MIKTATITIASPVVSFKGKGKARREAALYAIAPHAYSMEKGKAQLVATVQTALGKEATQEQVDAIRAEIVIGVATGKMPRGEFPADCAETIDQMEYTRLLVTSYAPLPPATTKSPRKLAKGKLGYRSAVQQRVIANAVEVASKVLAELELAGKTQTQLDTEKRAKQAKRAPTTGSNAPDALAHSALVISDKALTGADYVQHMQTQIAALLAYDKKNAKIRPIECSELADSLSALKQLANKAANAHGLRLAQEQADKAATEK